MLILESLSSGHFCKRNSDLTETNADSGHVIFRDFLREQIDNLMTGDGRDGLAEGRRGTHVEVNFGLDCILKIIYFLDFVVRLQFIFPRFLRSGSGQRCVWPCLDIL